MVDRQIAGNTGNAVRRCAKAHNRAEPRTDCAADYAAHERTQKPQVDTEDSGLGNAQGC